MNEQDIQDIKQFDIELKQLMEKFHVKIDIAIDFPQYNMENLPEEIKFVLYIFNKFGGVLKPKYKKIT